MAGNEANFFVRDVTGGSRLPFRIRPGAPTSSIDISASGIVGVGTASPAINVDVRSAAAATPALVGVSNSDNSSYLSIFSGRSTNDPAFIYPTGKNLRFGIGDYAGAVSYSEKMRIDLNGNVGIGVTAPTTQLHTTAGVRFAGVPCGGGGLSSDANGVVGCVASTREVKNVAGDLMPQVALANVMALRPQVGSYKATPDIPEHWLIAEETAAVDPALVGLVAGKPYVVKTQNVVADLIAVVQQQQRRIEDQQRFIEEQQRRLEALERASAGEK